LASASELAAKSFLLSQQLRHPARYLDKPLELEDVDSVGLLRTIGAFIQAVESRVQIAF
jgi:hypothetical protein